MTFVAAAFLVATVKKLVDLTRTLTAKSWREALTLAVALVAGVGLTFIVAASDFASSFEVNGVPLSNLNAWSIVLVGVNIACAAAFGNDVLAAVDSSRSSYVPPLGMKPGVLGGAGSVTQAPTDPTQVVNAKNLVDVAPGPAAAGSTAHLLGG